MKRSPLNAALALVATAALASPTFAQEGAEKKAEEKAEPAAETAADKPAEKTDPKKVVVIVDGVEITQGEIDKRLATQYGARLKEVPPEHVAMMLQQAVPAIKQAIISETILLAAADKEKIEVDKEKHAKMLEEILGNIPDGTTKEQFYEKLSMTEAELNAALDREIRINALLEKQASSVPEPTDAQTKKFYDDNQQEFVITPEQESVTASHILINTKEITDETEKANKKAELEALRKQIIEKKGENFAELATAHSDCPSGKRSGGSLGQFGHGQMVPEFDKAAFAQEVGVVGEIIETSFGYHIIKVTDKVLAGTTPYEDVKEGIANHLKREKQEPIITAYIAKLNEAAKIEDLTEPKTAPEPAPEVKEAPAPAEKKAPAPAEKEAPAPAEKKG